MGQTEERKQVYFKSDFAEVFDFKDVLGREIPSLSGLDFKIEFWVNDGDCDFGIPYTGKKYIVGRNASGKKGVMVLDDGRVAVAFDRHLLPPGKLWGEITVRRVDSLYPDGYQDVAVKFNTGIELTTDAGCATDMAEMAVLLPFIKGKWEDLTPEEIAELQRPATEAAENIRRDMTALEKTLNENEKVRIENEAVRQREENTRRESESVRTAHESERQTAERGRQTAETERGKQEDIRVSNENARIEAENKRAETFSGWKTELDSKAGREELSNIVGVPAEEEIEDLEPGIMATLLRTVPQVLTPEEQAQVKENIGGIRDVFIDLWNAACGVWGRYNEVTGFFELNGLTDITYAEAMKIYEAGAITTYDCAGYFKISNQSIIRTNLPRKLNSQWGYNSQGFNAHNFIPNFGLEVLNLEPFWGEDPNGFMVDTRLNGNGITSNFYNISDYEWGNSTKLKRIIGVIDLRLMPQGKRFDALTFCKELVDVKIRNCGCHMRLTNAPKLSLESVSYLVENATATTAGSTIQIERGIYAKLTDETNTEWHPLLAQAADKNITFATV